MNKHQVKILSNLRPETVVAVKGVPFAIRGGIIPRAPCCAHPQPFPAGFVPDPRG